MSLKHAQYRIKLTLDGKIGYLDQGRMTATSIASINWFFNALALPEDAPLDKMDSESQQHIMDEKLGKESYDKEEEEIWMVGNPLGTPGSHTGLHKRTWICDCGIPCLHVTITDKEVLK